MKRIFLVSILFIALTTVSTLEVRQNNFNKLARLQTRLKSLSGYQSSQLTERNFLTFLLDKLTSFSFAERLENFIEKLKSWSSTEPDEEGSGRNDDDVLINVNIEEDEHFWNFLDLLQYLGFDDEAFLSGYELFVWAFQNAGQVPMVMDVMNTILQDLIAQLPLDTINQLVDLVPWHSLDEALATANNTNIENLKELVFEFKPFVKKVLELYEIYKTNDESVVAVLKFAVSSRIAKLGASGQRTCSSKRVVCYYPNWTYYRKGMRYLRYSPPSSS